jgi:hypothetical protein
MELRRLLDALHAFDFRQKFMQQPARVKQFESPPRAAFNQNANQLLPYPFRGH